MGMILSPAEIQDLAERFPECARQILGTPHPDAAAPSAKGPRRNKYGAVRTEYNGRKFDSKAEANHAERLDFEKTAGLIRDWVPQVTFHLGNPPITYRLDFLVWNLDGTTEGHETKGKRTEKAEIIFRAWSRCGPCPLKVYTGGKLYETIIPQHIMETTPR